MNFVRIFVFLLLCTGCAFAQTTDPQWGLVPFQTFSGSDFDKVNVKNGLLNFSIPLWSYNQRGGKIKLGERLQYNSGYYSLTTVYDPSGGVISTMVGHSSVTTVPYSQYTGAVIRSIQSAGFNFVSDGSPVVKLVAQYKVVKDGETVYRTGEPSNGTQGFNETTLVTPDGAAHPFNTLSDGSGVSMSLDGTGYRTGATGILDSSGVGGGLEDADGNTIGSVDTFGRNLPSFTTSNSTSGCTGTLAISSVSIATAPGANGTTETFKFCYVQLPIYISMETSGAQSDLNTTLQVLQSVVLPNNQSWTFEYNASAPGDPAGTNYGEVTKIILPTGGSISYTYDWGDHPEVTSRTVFDGISSHTWLYNSSTGAGGDFNSGAASVTDPAGNVTLTEYNSEGYEGRSKIYDGSSTLLKQIDTTYLPGVHAITPSESVNIYSTIDDLPQTVTTTLPDGSVSKKVFTYCCDYSFTGFGIGFNGTNESGGTLTETASYGIKTGEDDYDWGSGAPGALLKSTHTDFLWQTNPAYLNANLLNTPAVVTVKDGSGNTVSQVTYTYDEAGSVGISSGMTANQQLSSPPASGVYGHPTTVAHLLMGGSNPTTHATYYDTGEVASTEDANGNSTTFQYSLAYWGGLPTTVSNALNQTTTFTYDLNTGQKTSATDANGQTTNWTFDNYGRLTLAQEPGGSPRPTTSICYDDTPGTCQSDSPLNAIVVAQTLTSSVSLIKEQRYDALGRDAGSRLLSDPGGVTYTLKTYDPLGRLYQTWNPSRCPLDPTTSTCAGKATFGTTTLAYDALGRIRETTQPDNTTKLTSYSGSTTTTTDEAGNAWTSTEDALGRLTRVQEPNGAATGYIYDSLDNLTNVTQYGVSGETPRSRSFTYDSLSRLVTSNNPETGVVCYGQMTGGNCAEKYDANGNLKNKTDANGITSSYSYDALNRLTLKILGDGTPSEAFGYDGKDEGGNPIQNLPTTNGIGRLTHVSNQVNAASDLQYDAMGRLIAKKDCNVHDCSYGDSQSFGYDLGGNMTSIGYADGRVVQQQFDGAGHLSAVTDMTGGTPGIVYFAAQGYTPAGALNQAGYGNGVTEHNAYNSRLQPCHSYSSTAIFPDNPTGGNLLDRQSFYNASASSPCGSEVGNNGNIYAITDNLNTGWTQSFNYDGMNRIITAGRSDGGYNHTYNYDSFGNMIPQDNLHNNPDLRIDAATNRLYRYASNAAIYAYDNAGNLTSTGTSDVGGHSYSYNVMGQVTGVDGGNSASYAYTALDERASKITPSGWTDYVYLNGQPMSEHNSDGSWNDYIYAGGQKIAMVGRDERLHREGQTCSGCTSDWTALYTGTSIHGRVVQAGDRLVVSQYSAPGTMAGVGINTTDGSYGPALGMSDQDGNGADADRVTGVWHQRVIDLTNLVGRTVDYAFFMTPTGGSSAPWSVDYRDFVYLGADGSVTKVYAGEDPAGSPQPTTSGMTVSSTMQVGAPFPGGVPPVHYYIDDHLGTAQVETGAAGWPTWKGQFTPFGQELDNGETANHYKFTGKERDSESGLDYFGARYYASSMGRFMSPDWAAKASPIPYAQLGNPQSLNLYSYVQGKVESSYDADGHLLSRAEFEHPHKVSGYLGLGETSEIGAENRNDAAETQQQSGAGGPSVTIAFERDGSVLDHVSMYVSDGTNWVIYDPDGNYATQRQAGYGDVVTSDNDGASRSDWISYQRQQGSGALSSTLIWTYPLSAADASKIKGNVDKDSNSGDNQRALPCAHSVSTVISGIGPFQNVHPVSLLPASLARQLYPISHVDESK